MKVGTGSKADCLNNISCYASPPEPTLVDRGVPDPVQTTPWRLSKSCDSRTDGKLRFNVTFASDDRTTKRCPLCRVLLVKGPSYDEHVFFCRESRP